MYSPSLFLQSGFGSGGWGWVGEGRNVKHQNGTLSAYKMLIMGQRSARLSNNLHPPSCVCVRMLFDKTTGTWLVRGFSIIPRPGTTSRSCIGVAPEQNRGSRCLAPNFHSPKLVHVFFEKMMVFVPMMRSSLSTYHRLLIASARADDDENHDGRTITC